MPIFANEWPSQFVPGSDFVQIEDQEFSMASEPQGLIAVLADNDLGYLTVQAAKRLLHCLSEAIKNSEAERPFVDVADCACEGADDAASALPRKNDDDIPF